MGLITNAQNPGLKKVSDGPFSINQHVAVPSNTPINIKEISGHSINSRTLISMWNFAAELFAELVPLRLLKCLEMGVNPFPLEIIFSQAHWVSFQSMLSVKPLVCPLLLTCICVVVFLVGSCKVVTIRGNDCTSQVFEKLFWSLH